jgi:hypothetical protein
MQKFPGLASILLKLTPGHPVIKTGRKHTLHTTGNFSFEQNERSPDQLRAILRSKGNEHAIIAYNDSDTDARLELVALNRNFDHINKLRSLYGYEYCSMVDVIHRKQGKRQHNFIQLYMFPKQLVILEAC